MRKLFYILLTFSLVSCAIDKDYFGESTEALVTKFDIEDQISVKVKPYVDNDDEGLIEVTMPSTAKLNELTVRTFTLSHLASTPTNILEITDFSSEILFTVYAENALYKKNWKIKVIREGDGDEPEDPDNPTVPTPQLPFSNMKVWTKMLNKNGAEIFIQKVNDFGYTVGDGTRQVWSTTAEANAYSLSGINYFTSHPKPSVSSADYARLETVESTTAAVFAKSGVVAGALFTGKFIFNPKWGLASTSAPRKMLDFGTPFNGKPKQAKLKYRYTPGKEMKDGLLAVIPSTDPVRATVDSCEVYFILHNRSEATWKRVGAAWLRDSKVVGSATDASSFVEVTLDFVYGKPSDDILAKKPFMKIGGTRGELIFYTFKSEAGESVPSDTPVSEVFADDPTNTDVTHITVMFSSSAYGDKFWAATNGTVAAGELRGSTLDVKDVELVY